MGINYISGGKIPSPTDYPETGEVHSKIAERAWQVQEERFADNYPGGRPLNEVLGPEKTQELFGEG